MSLNPFPLSLTENCGVITEMVEAWRLTTESPDAFLFANALQTVGVAAGPGTYFQHGPDQLFLNLWHLIIGPPGTLRKSTSLKLPRKMADLAGLKPFTFPKSTLEGLFYLARILDEKESSNEDSEDEESETQENEPQQNFGLWIEDEFSTFTEVLNRDYNRGLQSALLDSYGGDFIEGFTLSRGLVKSKLMGLSLLSATTFSTISFKVKDFTSGYFSRWNIFIVDQLSGRIMPKRSQFPPEVEKKIAPFLADLRKKERVLKLNGEAEGLYESWYVKNYHLKELDERVQSFYARNSDHVLKYAGIFSLADGTDTVDVKHLERAISLIDWQRSNLAEVLGNATETQHNRDTRRILAKLDSTGGVVLRSQLLRDLNFTADKLDVVIRTMKESGLIVERIVESPLGGKGFGYVKVPTL